MIKYLDFVLEQYLTANDFELPEFILEQFEIYKKYWNQYSSDDCSLSPRYTASHYSQLNTHTICLTTGETVTISWDVDDLYKRILPTIPVKEIPFFQFEFLTLKDRANSADVFKQIETEVNSIHEHSYAPMIIMNLKPTEDVIFLDGRHRYIEHKKFHPDDLIPMYYLDDEICSYSIPHSKDFLVYAILFNLAVIKEYFENPDLQDDCVLINSILHIEQIMKSTLS